MQLTLDWPSRFGAHDWPSKGETRMLDGQNFSANPKSETRCQNYTDKKYEEFLVQTLRFFTESFKTVIYLFPSA